MLKKILLFAVFVTLYKISIHPTFAQSLQSSIGVAPAILEEVISPNSQKESVIYIYNLSNNPIPIKTETRKFHPQEELINDSNDIFDIQSWIKIYPQEFILQANTRKAIKVVIKPPPETEPGSHFGTIVFKPMLPVDNSTNSKINISSQVGVLTFLTVNGKIIEENDIESLKTKKIWINQPVKFDLKIRNSGNVHTSPQGHITIKTINQKLVAKIPLLPKTVLPQTNRLIETELEKRFLIGLYSVQSEITYSTNHQTLISQPVYFFVLPLVIIIPFILLTLIVINITINYQKFILVLKILFNRNQ